MTREQKIFGAILGVALSALAVDRVILGGGASGPEAADAQLIADPKGPTAQPATPATTQATTAPPAPDLTRASIAQRLENLAATIGTQSQPLHNAFELPWPTTPLEEPEPPGIDQRRFVNAHRLLAVFGSDDASYAVIDGKIYKPGQTLDGLTLVALRRRSVIFEAAGQQVELRLDPASPAQ